MNSRTGSGGQGPTNEPCSTCGGDGRLINSFGSHSTCPSCHGSGRRAADEPRFRDVTKTKESHHQNTNKRGEAAPKPTWPSTPSGIALATEVNAAGGTAETKARLVREIMDHESKHGLVTQTFVKKVRKQLRPTG